MNRGIAGAAGGAAAVALALSVPPPLPASGTGSVAASIAPLADIVRKVAGDDLPVHELFPPGVNPMAAVPSREALRELTAGVLYVRVGSVLEGNADSLVAEAAGGDLAVLDLSRGVDLIGPSIPEAAEDRIYSAALGLDDGGTGRGDNPFLWLDPLLVREFVDDLASALSEVRPTRRAEFEKRAAALTEGLEELDRGIRERLRDIRGKPFATFSGAPSYFCRRYGLKEVPVTGVTPGGGPGRQSLKGTVSRLQRLGVGAVFSDPSFPRRPAETAAGRAGVRLLVLEPFGAPGRGGYFEMMGHTLDLIEEGLRSSPQ